MEPDNAVQDTESTPQTPGPILRRCREFHGMSLADAAEATKIGKNYLRALEEDRHQEFASPAYLKGFLRIYANHLGLHADDLLKMLEPDQTEEPAAGSLKQEQQLEGSRFTWQRLVLPTMLLTLIIIVALVMRPDDEPVVRPPQPAAPVPVAAVQQPRSSARTDPAVTPATPALPAAAATTTPQSGVTLRIKAVRKGSLVVTMDDVTTQAYELTAGDLIEWRADRSINLDITDPGSAELEVNGKPYRPAAQPGKPATLTLTEQGAKP